MDNNVPVPPPEAKPTVKKPLRPITQLLISIAIIAVVVIATVFLFKYPQKLGPIFITALVVTLAEGARVALSQGSRNLSGLRDSGGADCIRA